MGASQLQRQLLGQARLAEAGAATQRDDRVAAQQAFQLMQFFLAADERRQAQRQTALGGGLGGAGLRHVQHRQREAITEARDGGDGLRAQQLAQHAHLYGEVVLLDDDTGPDALHQLVLGHQLARSLDEGHQELEGSRRQCDFAAAAEQQPLGGQQFEIGEAVVGRAHG